MKQVLADTGPLVAYLDRSSEFHRWTKEQFALLSEPLRSCEAVLTETLFLLKRNGIDPGLALDLVERGIVVCDFQVGREIAAVRKLLAKYRDLPATLADVCLVRMSELAGDCSVLTLDRDFLIYRRHGRRTIPLIAPF